MKKHKSELATITSLEELESRDRFLQWARRHEELTSIVSALTLIFLPVWLLVTAMLLSMSGLVAGIGFLILCLSFTGASSYAHLLASFSYPYHTRQSSRSSRLVKRRGQRQLLKLDCKTGWRPRAGAKMPPGRSDSYDRWEVCIEGNEKGFRVWSQCWTYGGVWKSKVNRESFSSQVKHKIRFQEKAFKDDLASFDEMVEYKTLLEEEVQTKNDESYGRWIEAQADGELLESRKQSNQDLARHLRSPRNPSF